MEQREGQHVILNESNKNKRETTVLHESNKNRNRNKREITVLHEGKAKRPKEETETVSLIKMFKKHQLLPEPLAPM
jgi:hypothetical protein